MRLHPPPRGRWQASPRPITRPVRTGPAPSRGRRRGLGCRHSMQFHESRSRRLSKPTLRGCLPGPSADAEGPIAWVRSVFLAIGAIILAGGFGWFATAAGGADPAAGLRGARRRGPHPRPDRVRALPVALGAVPGLRDGADRRLADEGRRAAAAAGRLPLRRAAHGRLQRAGDGGSGPAGLADHGHGPGPSGQPDADPGGLRAGHAADHLRRADQHAPRLAGPERHARAVRPAAGAGAAAAAAARPERLADGAAGRRHADGLAAAGQGGAALAGCDPGGGAGRRRAGPGAVSARP